MLANRRIHMRSSSWRIGEAAHHNYLNQQVVAQHHIKAFQALVLSGLFAQQCCHHWQDPQASCHHCHSWQAAQHSSRQRETHDATTGKEKGRGPRVSNCWRDAHDSRAPTSRTATTFHCGPLMRAWRQRPHFSHNNLELEKSDYCQTPELMTISAVISGPIAWHMHAATPESTLKKNC